MRRPLLLEKAEEGGGQDAVGLSQVAFAAGKRGAVRWDTVELTGRPSSRQVGVGLDPSDGSTPPT